MNDPVTGWPLILWSYEGERGGVHRWSICAQEGGELLNEGGHACVVTVKGRTEAEAKQRAEWVMDRLR